MKVIPDALCARCGTCEGVCPEGIIREDDRGFPIVLNREECTGCGLCKKVCPGMLVDFPPYCEDEESDFNPYLGFFFKVLSARSIDKKDAQFSASGGGVSALLKYLFKENLINCAFTVKIDNKYPFAAYPYLSRNIEDVEDSRQSKYQPVMLNKLLREMKDDDKAAVVGLPCHLHGLRKAEEAISSLRDKIILHIGLFCGFNMEREATFFLIRKLGMMRNDIENIYYRSGRWPGGFLVEDTKGNRKFVSKEDYSLLNYLFLPKRCSTCPDYSAELSDISFGDAWYKKTGEGWNSVIVRNKEAQSILEGAELVIEEANAEMIVDSHKFVIDFKKRGALKRIAVANEEYPKFNNYPSSLLEMTLSSFDKYFLIFYRWRNLFINIFRILPFSLFRITSRLLRRKSIGK